MKLFLNMPKVRKDIQQHLMNPIRPSFPSYGQVKRLQNANVLFAIISYRNKASQK